MAKFSINVDADDDIECTPPAGKAGACWIGTGKITYRPWVGGAPCWPQVLRKAAHTSGGRPAGEACSALSPAKGPGRPGMGSIRGSQ